MVASSQLDIFSLEPLPLEPIAPAPPLPQPPNPHTVAWQQAKADFYLRLMNRFISGTRCSQSVRSHEITRLYNLRQQALQDL